MFTICIYVSCGDTRSRSGFESGNSAISSPDVGEPVREAKALGCYAEADGGCKKERGHRSSKASMVWQKLKKRISRAKIGRRTKGQLFRSAVIASMLCGLETRDPSRKEIKKMHSIIGGYERHLYSAPGGSTKIMKGMITQAGIREKLGTLFNWK